MRLIPVVLLGAMLIVPAVARDDDYRRDRSNGSWQRFGAPPVRAAIRDMQAVASRGLLTGRDRDRLYSGVERLRRFEDRLRDGRWDGGALDKAIENIRDVSDSGRLHPRDRSVLRGHLYALRDFRANHGSNAYGYGNTRGRWPY